MRRWWWGGGAGGSDAFSVAAPDGSAKIDFPTGALPAGVRPGDIRIGPIPTDDVLTVDEGPPAVCAYELLPDGLQLLQPARVTIFGTPEEFGSGVWVLRVHGDEVDLVTDLLLTIHERDAASVTYSVERFSEDCVTRLHGVTLQILTPPPGSAWGLTPIPVTVHLTHTAGAKHTYVIYKKEKPAIVDITIRWGTWGMHGGKVSGVVALTPREVLLPSNGVAGVPPDSAWSGSCMMTCGEAGPATLAYGVTIEQLADVRKTVPGKEPETNVRAVNANLFLTRDLHCLSTDMLSCAGFEGTEDAVAVGQSLGQPAEAVCQDAHEASTGVTPHSSDEISPKETAGDHTSLATGVPGWWVFPDGWYRAIFGNTVFPCGDSDFGFTLCPSQSAAGADGEWCVLSAVFAADIPLADGTNTYQYAFVFDADGDTTNNYEASVEYPNDFFQDTDRWYVATYDPTTGWAMEVTDATNGTLTTVPSAARIVIQGNAIVLAVPAAEFALVRPKYRLTAFRHTGDYGLNPPHDWDGSLWPPVDQGLQDWP